MEIYLIRHGESEGNVLRAGGGRHDWPLSPLGRAQADALSRSPLARSFTHIFASPLSRAQDTARAIANSCNAQIETDGRLIDVDAGSLNGAPWSVIREKYMDFFRSVPRSTGLAFPGGGESNRDVIERTRAFADSLKSRFRFASNSSLPNAEHHYDPAAHVAIIGHGLPLNYLLQLLLELEPAGIESFQFANASVTQVSFKLTYPVLAVYNDVSHLANLEGAPPFSQGIETNRGPAPGE